jgi:hypothetical protein
VIRSGSGRSLIGRDARSSGGTVWATGHLETASNA